MARAFVVTSAAFISVCARMPSMRSGPLYCVLWMLIACLAGGCVMPGGAKSTAQDKPPISKEDQDAAKKVASKKSKKDPKKDADSKTDSTKSVAKKKEKEAEKSTDGAKESLVAKSGGHSATTKALIQSELRDAPPG